MRAKASGFPAGATGTGDQRTKRPADSPGPSNRQAKRVRKEDLYQQLEMVFPAPGQRTARSDPRVDPVSSFDSREGISCNAWIISITPKEDQGLLKEAKGKRGQADVLLAIDATPGRVKVNNPSKGVPITDEFRTEGKVSGSDRTLLVHYRAAYHRERDGFDVELPFFEITKNPREKNRNIYSPVSYEGAWTTRLTIPTGTILKVKHFGSLGQLAAGYAGPARITLVPSCKMVKKQKGDRTPGADLETQLPGDDGLNPAHRDHVPDQPLPAGIDLDEGGGGLVPYWSFVVSNITPLAEVSAEALPMARIAALQAAIVAAGVGGRTIPEPPFLPQFWARYPVNLGGANPTERSKLPELVEAVGRGQPPESALGREIGEALKALQADLARITEEAPENLTELATAILARLAKDQVAGQVVQDCLPREVKNVKIGDDDRWYYPIAANLCTAALRVDQAPAAGSSTGGGPGPIQQTLMYCVHSLPEAWSVDEPLNQLGLPDDPDSLTTFGSLLEKVSLAVVAKLDEGSKSAAQSLNPAEFTGGAAQVLPTKYFLDVGYQGFLDWTVPVEPAELANLAKKSIALDQQQKQALAKAKEWFHPNPNPLREKTKDQQATILQKLVDTNQAVVVNCFPVDVILRELGRKPSKCAIYLPHRVLLERVEPQMRPLITCLTDFLAYAKDPESYEQHGPPARGEVEPMTAFFTIHSALTALLEHGDDEPRFRPLVFLYSEVEEPAVWESFNRHLLTFCREASPTAVQMLLESACQLPGADGEDPADSGGGEETDE